MFDVIVVGSATRDAFFEGLPFDKHQDPHFAAGVGRCFPIGSKVEVRKITFTSGGAGTSAPITFARQGFGVATIIRVGKDVSGKTVHEELKKEGIDVRFAQFDPSLPTAYSVAFMTPEGERTIFTYKGAGQRISLSEIPWSRLKSKWFYINSLQGSSALLKKIISHARKNNVKLATNPGGKDLPLFRKQKSLMRAFDIFITNQEEASYLTGVAYKNRKLIFKRMNELVGEIVVMTLGPDGVLVSDGRYTWETGIFKERKLVDRTGAGDAFGSGFVAGIIKKNNIEYAVKLGSANATSVVENMGAHAGILTKSKFEKDKRWKKLKIAAKTPLNSAVGLPNTGG